MLPEKWQIKITEENKEILKKYWKALTPAPVSVNGCNVEKDSDFWGALLSYPQDGTWLYYGSSPEGTTEITLEDFKKYVLKEFDPEDWNIEVSTKEQFNEVCDFLLKKDYIRKHFWKNKGNGFEGGARFIGTSDDSEGFTYSGWGHYFNTSKRITWEQFQTLKNKKMKYTIQQIKNGKFCFFLTQEQYEKLNKSISTNLCGFKGDYVYSTNGTYDSSSSISNKGKWYDDYEFIKFEDIDFGEKIIGYKAPFVIYADTSSQRIEKDEVLIKASVSPYYKKKDGTLSEYYIAKEIVETWEPVYEEVIKSKVLSLGTPARDFEIFKDKIIITDGDSSKREFTSSDLQDLIGRFTAVSWKGYDSKMTSIQLGCSAGTELRLEDLKTIQETQKTL